MGRSVEIKKRMLGGGYFVSYECPHCAGRLKSPIEDAGGTDTCPECSSAFVVPGKDEFAQLRMELQAEEMKRQTANASRPERDLETQNQSPRSEPEDERLREMKRRMAALPAIIGQCQKCGCSVRGSFYSAGTKALCPDCGEWVRIPISEMELLARILDHVAVIRWLLTIFSIVFGIAIIFGITFTLRMR